MVALAIIIKKNMGFKLRGVKYFTKKARNVSAQSVVAHYFLKVCVSSVPYR